MIAEKFLLTPSKDRRQQLLSAYYQNHHQNRNIGESKDDHKKVQFFLDKIQEWKKASKIEDVTAVDLGCRGGALTTQLDSVASWIGFDIDPDAVKQAQAKGIPCDLLDISVNIDLTSAAFDVVMLTEVLEHLPYPAITVKEIHRILKKGRKSGLFCGSVPIDYNLHQRIRVARGQRVEKDPTHLHSFSFEELDTLLKHYFDNVEYLPLRGTATRHPWLPYKHFVRDIAWVASNPKKKTDPWQVRII